MKAVTLRIKFDGQHQAVAHEVQVAHDGAHGHFKLPGEPGAVGEGFFPEEIVEAHHALQWRTTERL